MDAPIAQGTETATPNTSAEAPAEAATAPEASGDELDQLLDAADAAASAAKGEAPKQEAEEPQGKKPFRPQSGKTKAESALARIEARKARQAERARSAGVEQQLEQMQRQLHETRSQFESRQRRAQEALQKGDVDTALKETLGVDFSTINARVLEQKRGTPPKDPEVEAKLKMLDQLLAERQQQQQEWQQQQERARQEREMQEYFTDVEAGIRELGDTYEHVDKLAENPLLVQAIGEEMADNNLTIEAATAKVVETLEKSYQKLLPLVPLFSSAAHPEAQKQEAPSGAAPPAGSIAEANPGRPEQRSEANRVLQKKAPTNLTQADAAEATGGSHGQETEDEMLERLIRMQG